MRSSIIAFALFTQTATAATMPGQDERPSTEAGRAHAAAEIEALTNDLFTVIGTCEAQLPASMIQGVTWPFSPAALDDATEDQRARLAPMAAAYAAGKASADAGTLTPEECSAELEAVSAKMTAIAERQGL